MSSKHFEYAVKLDEYNADAVIAFAHEYGWDLTPDVNMILDPRFWSAQAQSTYIDMVWDYTRGIPTNFSSFPEYIFDSFWRFTDGTRGPFQRIVKS